jgi:hypothetical protein
MIKIGKTFVRNYMTLDFEFTGVRIQDTTLTSVDWYLSINLVAASHNGDKQRVEKERNASIAYQRLYFWLDANLPHVIAIDASNEDDLYIANLLSNIAMFCPGNPSDDLIIQLLHSKLSKIAGDDLIISEMTLRGSDTALQYTFDVQGGSYELPELTADYCLSGIARDKQAWWTRNDGFCFEFIMPEDSDALAEEIFKEIVDPLDEFNKVILEMTDSKIGIVREPAKIVQVEKWKPKKVEE